MKNTPNQFTNRKNKIYGILSGLVMYVSVGSAGLYLLRICWPNYAQASLDKSYTTKMLFFRLLVGIVAAVFAGLVSKRIGKEEGRSAWLVGAVVFCTAAYIHIFRVWADYPTWYHFAYLLPIIPIIGLSHYLFYKNRYL